MGPDAGFVDHCIELLSSLGATRARRMFGGHGLYVDERFIALIAEQRLYLKADEHTREAFASAGCSPFEYPTKDGRRQVTSYWSAPDEAMDSPALMLPWVQLALAAALRAPAAKRRPAPSPSARIIRTRPRKAAP